MQTSMLSSMRGKGYQQAVAVAKTTLNSQFGCGADEYLDVAIHAMNACRLYVKTGRLRLSHTPMGVPVIQIVTRTNVIMSPSIQQLLMWATPETVISFLTRTSGIGQIINMFPQGNPF